MSPTQQLDTGVRPVALHTTNHALKVIAKRVLRNDDLVLFMKAAKIAVESRTGRPSDLIFPLLPQVIGKPDPIIIDVGANMGQFASRVGRQFPAGRIYSFEPVHSNLIGLRRVLRWLRVKNVEIFDAAICDTSGLEAIHIPSFDSYQDGTLAVLEGSKRTYGNVTYHVETVRTDTLNAFAAARGIERLDFLKIDTEGAEERVVRGGMTIITAFLPTLYMEATPDQPWLDALYTLGYRPFYTDGVKLHPPRPRERQNDVLLVHDTKIDRLSPLIEV